MGEYKTFETERLILKTTSFEDAEFVLKLFNCPKWLKYIGSQNVKSVDEAQDYIADKMLPQLERLGFGNYTVIRKLDFAKLGICGLYDREGLAGIDIGFAFLPDYEGNGYALEAAKRLKQAAFDDFSINEIVAITTKDNLASQTLLRKLGLALSATTKISNDEEELLLYKITK
jgi:RimJ/RimL family protein N-acetyltransferase